MTDGGKFVYARMQRESDCNIDFTCGIMVLFHGRSAAMRFSLAAGSIEQERRRQCLIQLH